MKLTADSRWVVGTLAADCTASTQSPIFSKPNSTDGPRTHTHTPFHRRTTRQSRARQPVGVASTFESIGGSCVEDLETKGELQNESATRWRPCSLHCARRHPAWALESWGPGCQAEAEVFFGLRSSFSLSFRQPGNESEGRLTSLRSVGCRCVWRRRSNPSRRRRGTFRVQRMQEAGSTKQQPASMQHHKAAEQTRRARLKTWSVENRGRGKKLNDTCIAFGMLTSRPCDYEYCASRTT